MLLQRYICLLQFLLLGRGININTHEFKISEAVFCVPAHISQIVLLLILYRPMNVVCTVEGVRVVTDQFSALLDLGARLVILPCSELICGAFFMKNLMTMQRARGTRLWGGRKNDKACIKMMSTSRVK